MSVEDWLGELDPQLIVYAPHFKELGFNSKKMMRFLKLKDFMKMPCKIPAPHRRMILNAVLKLQTPESKTKEKIDTPDSDEVVIVKKKKTTSSACSTSNMEPRKLFVEANVEPDEVDEASTSTSIKYEGKQMQDTVEQMILREKNKLEQDLIKQKKQLTDLMSSPIELMPLSLPGCRMMASTCTRCHHRGHRKEGNKNGVFCQFEECVGYHYCGNEKLHPEFKVEKREKERSIRNIELQIRQKEEELSHLKEFAKKSETNFIRNVRPRLQRLFPNLYKGKDGNQRLLRDTRLLKISCNGKIPESTANEREDLQELIRKGKSKVAQETGMPEETENFLMYEEMEQARLDRGVDSDEEGTAPKVYENPGTIHSNVNEQSVNNYMVPQYPTHTPLIPSTNLIYPPPPTFSTQSGKLYFDIEHSQFIQPYPFTYQQHQYNYPRYLPLVQNQQTFTNTSPDVPQPQHQSTSYSSTSTPLDTAPSISPNSNVVQSNDADQNTTLLDLANAALKH